MKVKLISIAAIILAGVIVAITTISAAVSKNNEYNGYLASARANAENQVPYTACQKYRQATHKCNFLSFILQFFYYFFFVLW